MFTFLLSIYIFCLFTRFLKPWSEMLGPFVGILLFTICAAFDYSCFRRLCNQEIFYFYCTEVIVMFVLLCHFVKFCCKCCGRGVRLPNFRAIHVLSNTFTLYPMMSLCLVCCVFFFVFRWRLAVCGWRMVGCGMLCEMVVWCGMIGGRFLVIIVGVCGGKRYVCIYKIVI
jgi:hypothetical protein